MHTAEPKAGRETAGGQGLETRLTAPLIRPASPADAETIAGLHVAAWRESYADLFPPEALASLDIAERARLWREILAGPASGATFLLEFAGEGPLGFSSCGAQRGDSLRAQGFFGEFEAVYILKLGQRRGGGRALMRAMARHLLGQGFEAASVWVFRDNPPARDFYEALGGVATGIDGTWTTLGQTLPDMSYGWRDLRPLARE